MGTVDGWEPLPAVRVGPWAMVKLPADINTASSERVRTELAGALAAGVRVLVADMSATLSCDEPGARMLVHTARRAARRGARLYLLTPPAAALQVVKRLGAEQAVQVCPSLSAAIADALDHPPPQPATARNTLPELPR